MGSLDFFFDVDEHGPLSADDSQRSSVARLTAHYRYLVQLSSAGGIAAAVDEALAAMAPGERDEVLRRLELEMDETAESLRRSGEALTTSHQAAELEQRDPGALERLLCGGAEDARERGLWLRFVRLLLSSESASARLASLLLPHDDPDFSEEFGYLRGFAGGEGFENVDFDRWV